MEWEAPWDLRQRGWKDARRHRERVKEAIRKNLRHLIVEESIITSQGDRKITVPVRYLTHYHFRYGEDWKGVGSGQGEPNDVIARKPMARGDGRNGDGRDDGAGDGAGDAPGQPVYEAEITLDELTEVMLEELNLPRLEQDMRTDIEVEEIRYDDVRKKGLIHNLDKRRTLFEHLKRQASKGEARIGQLDDEDLRYRTWRESRRPASRAAVYMMMDRSGSMGSEKRYIAKGFFFWLVRFLRLKYHRVELIFIAHDVEAEVVSEHDFFTVAASGGTRCSAAYRLALQHLKEIHPASSWNNYAFHFTDGENLPADIGRSAALMEELADHCRMVGYGEIKYGDWGSFYRPPAVTGAGASGKRATSPLFEAFAGLGRKNLVLTCIDHRDEIYRALQEFLTKESAA